VDPREPSAGFIASHAQTEDVRERWDWTALADVAHREAHAVARRSSDADDAAQRALLRAWRFASSCRSPDQPQPWVRSIARREALRGLTDATRKAEVELVAAHHPVAEAPSRREEVLDVRRAVGWLEPQDRLLFLLHYWQGLSVDDAARTLAIPVGTAKIRLRRGRGRLRTFLAWEE
jgi:RNA polymerase sigma-70 factor (ECF subfamily)